MRPLESTNLIHQYPMLTDVLNSVQEIALILDSERRIVYYNDKFTNFAKIYGLKAETGLKPGNAFNCIYAIKEGAECGETSFCKYCGGNKAIRESLNGNKTVSECRIAAENGNAFDLSVSAAPLKLEQQLFTLYCITDISSESRKQILEKIFFHDVNNIVNGLSLIIDMLNAEYKQQNTAEFEKGFDMLNSAVTSLKNEISSQHIITLAEKDELNVRPKNSNITAIIKEVSGFFEKTMSDSELSIITDISDDEQCIFTDPVLLKRVIINTVKNACEASAPGESVTIGYKDFSSSLLIYVNNKGVLTEKVRRSIFKRSFTTKGEGRGLGTYSMRLLTERYLKGRIYFTSEEEEGTTFFIKLPISLPYSQ